MTAAAVALLAVAVWVASLYVRPFGRCWRCHGHGTIRTRHRRRVVVCPLCHGLKRHQRFGSRTVHRLARSIRAEVVRTRAECAKRASRED